MSTGLSKLIKVCKAVVAFVAFSRLFSKRQLECSQMSNPRDMAASSIHRCLYIMEIGTSPELLLCLDAATGDVKAQCNITNEGLNVAVDQRSGNVLLMCAKEIVEYDHNGQKIRVIAFPTEGMDMLWQAIPLSDTQFVICQVGCVLCEIIPVIHCKR